MEGRLKAAVWTALVLFLLLIAPGMKIRLDNEYNNKSILPAADYNDFMKSAQKAHLDINTVLNKLLENNVKTAAVKEITLGDLSYSGNAYISALGELLSALRHSSPQTAEAIKKTIGSSRLNPSACIIISGDPGTSSFLKERLGKRISPAKLMYFEISGQTYFYIGAELENPFNLGLGFDEDALIRLKAAGFELLLRPLNAPEPEPAYISEYERVIREFGVKYIIFDGSSVAGEPAFLNEMAAVLQKHGVISGIIESPVQVKYVPQKGLENLMVSVGFAINRAYIIPQTDLSVLGKDDLFFRWVRSVVDRSIRLVYINVLNRPEFSTSVNIQDTISAAGGFNSFISTKGYFVNAPLNKLSPAVPGKFHNLLVMISLLAALVLFLIYLSGIGPRQVIKLSIWGTAVCLVVFASARLLHVEIPQYLALLSAIIYPSLSSLLVLKYLKKPNNSSLTAKILLSTGIQLAVNALGIYTIICTMADIRYTMNLLSYDGVIISYIVPLILFAFSYLSEFTPYKTPKNIFARFRNIEITYKGIILFVLGAVIFYIYLSRSGNNSLIPATYTELEVRKFLERFLLARPRFKELLIGYPSLFAFIYLHHKRIKNNRVMLILGMGSVIGSISVLNSFCHVFTAVNISVLRSFNGLAIGSVLGVLLILVLRFVLNKYGRT